ncbi:hypothetical protein FSARC_11547 [Fusarium sarcochroum]|uniref:Uncharacterized protein n=1 Tax=Fusarium sarcochroum TaxID=1208366 RepID=A0A8H4TEH8_9HYPO|nr:hypothetical protein FSARC_11547 [Fusarium sarcochroum]
MAGYNRVPGISESSHKPRDTFNYGCPAAKPLADSIDLLALVSSLCCLAACWAVVGYSPFSWRIRFTYQLVLIGFLLSIMNLCNRRLARHLFVVSEARWGSMTLQNIDAILQQSVFVSGSSPIWRIVIFIMNALPIGLGVAYKTFTGGHASRVMTEYSAVHYGAFNRPMENNDFQIIALVDEMTAMRNMAYDDDNFPTTFNQSTTFGYNLALLSGNELAMVDMPNDTTLGEIQQKLALNEYIYLSADVWGTLARYNSSTLGDDSLWNSSHTTTMETYSGWRTAVARGLEPNMWAVTGVYRHPDGHPGASASEIASITYDSPDNDFVRAFRNSSFARGFNIYRLPCSVTWNMTLTDIQIISADCDIYEARHMEWSIMPHNPDLEEKVLDAVSLAMGSFGESRPNSPWEVPSAAMASLAVWTGRWKHLLPSPGDNLNTMPPKFIAEFRYKPKNEKFELVRHVVRASPLLYVIFAIQPFLSTMIFLMTMCFYSTPISTNFGLTTILASIKPSSLKLLSGAGLSGKLKQRIHLTMSVEERSGVTYRGKLVIGKIQTELQTKDDLSTAEDSSNTISKIQRGKKYM